MALEMDARSTLEQSPTPAAVSDGPRDPLDVPVLGPRGPRRIAAEDPERPRSPATDVFSNELLCRLLILACPPDLGAWSAMSRVSPCAWKENSPSLRKRVLNAMPAFRSKVAVFRILGNQAEAEQGPLLRYLDCLARLGRPSRDAFNAAYNFMYAVCTGPESVPRSRGTLAELARRLPVDPSLGLLRRSLDAAALALEGTPEIAMLARVSRYFLRERSRWEVDRNAPVPRGLGLLYEQLRLMGPVGGSA